MTNLHQFVCLPRPQSKNSATDENERALSSWEDHEDDQEATERRDEIVDAEMNPRRKCVHKVFVVINGITVIIATLMFVAQLLGIYFKTLSLVDYVLRVYIIALCAMIVMNELEWTSVIRESRLLRNWLTRGLIYAFVGVLGIEQYEASPSGRHDDSAHFDVAMNFIRVVSNIMVGVGGLYFVMGICCMQLVSNKLRHEYEERVARAGDMHAAAQTYNDVA
uniref:Golgi apparatus membrane protein TVP15 n=1 Tax=Craspedostauros australis TaxID=1486917 RepID=A0A7R9WMH7_9STRA|mmetsp:Transcript_10080/g.27624  ORF Transcript_10080/g.27624 Transcript_10080/m.27624 type:complete len:221 (+) Transcript_10080:459-1121(+)